MTAPDDQMPAIGITFGPAALLSLGHKEAAARAIQEQNALIRLTVVAGPQVLPDAMEEVHRRLPRLRSRAAALDSVADDIIAGRWRTP